MSLLGSHVGRLAVFLTVVVIVLFTTGLWQSAVVQEQSDEGAVRLETLFPQKAAGLRLVTLQQGAEALEEIDSLHGKPIAAEDAAIAAYHGEAGPPAEVWVSLASSPDAADEQVRVMVEKMLAAGKSPFHGHQRLEKGARTVHQFQGMGQAHYIWTHGEQAWWISAPPAVGPQLLDVFLAE